MTPRRGPPSGGWIGLQWLGGDGAAAHSATAQLIEILDAVEAPVLVLRRDLVIVAFNRAAANALGLSPSHVGRASRDVSALAGFSKIEDHCARVIAGGVDSRADFRDGDKWFVVRIAPYLRNDREVAGTVLTFTNVTAFRSSIDQAIYEREFTKAILNTVADPLVVLSADQRILSGNRAFYTAFGVSRDETQGVPLHDLGEGAFELTPLRAQLEEMLADGHAFKPVEVELVLAGKDRRTLVLDARPLSLPGHSEHRFLITFQDITARKQAEAAKDLRSEEELRRSEAFLAEGQRLSLTGSFSWRVATGAITSSEQLHRIFELEPGTPVTLESIGSRVHPEDRPLFDDMIDRARGSREDFDYEYRLLMPNGSVKYLHLIAHGARDRHGHLEYIGAAQDVTHRRVSEEALAKVRTELAHVSRVATLGVLTASIAHELNQPLAGIVTNSSTCLRMLAADPPDVDGARETARRTIRDGNRAAAVISRLRALFGRKDTATEPLDLNEATREVIALSLSELQRNRVVVRTELATDLPSVMGDRVQLQQVILNLLLNASDAMRSVDDRSRQLVVRSERDDGDRVRLTVQDAGVGLDPDHITDLFQAFYTTKRDGMGIGLSVSRLIIESHQGSLWATANEGPGASFSFSVPCAHPRPTNP